MKNLSNQVEFPNSNQFIELKNLKKMTNYFFQCLSQDKKKYA